MLGDSATAGSGAAALDARAGELCIEAGALPLCSGDARAGSTAVCEMLCLGSGRLERSADLAGDGAGEDASRGCCTGDRRTKGGTMGIGIGTCAGADTARMPEQGSGVDAARGRGGVGSLPCATAS